MTPTGYQPQSIDTSIEADQLLFTLLRQRSNADRLLMAIAQHEGFRALFLAGLRKRFNQLTPKIVATAFLKADYPDAFTPFGNEMTWIQDSIGLALQLHEVFEALEIPYYVTGGVAAINYGEYRTTTDVDIVLSVSADDIRQLATDLAQIGFYVPGVEDAVSGRMRTLQITHMETIARADLVVAGDEAFDIAKFQRRQVTKIPGRGSLYFASPEDVVLNKLRWRQRGQSEKQWRDVLGVLKVQSTALDINYLQEWAERLGLSTDLATAMQQAGLS
ncbi:MAG: hypothetical protein AAF215_23895 [Cyanobacteria bacterium P01_A01_bin.123]